MVTTARINRSSTPKKPTNGGGLAKKPAKPNASILSFFQKTPKPEDSLFVGPAGSSTVKDDNLYDDDHHHRFNESDTPVKRRRLSQDEPDTSNGEATDDVSHSPAPVVDAVHISTRSKSKLNAPFIMESDSEDDDDNDAVPTPDVPRAEFKPEEILKSPGRLDAKPSAPVNPPTTEANPPLHKEDSTYAQFDELSNFEGMDDLDLDDFEGEEMREMKFMREQARLEAEEAGTILSEEFVDDFPDGNSMTESCPICDGNLAGLSTDDATRHVNACLDGNPTPLPKQTTRSPPQEAHKVDSAEMSKRFARAAIPRPAQSDPFSQSNSGSGAKSAFSKLMSGNAEDSAWANAAAAENASRGRPAYERTCPFYKSIPNYNICVDAFRYGAVQGCEAYFLSHFHSDHYIGLTANWRHGPIYCSKVTGSLVKQQLRTASNWVVELEFEITYPVPGTGATVTMIPANHCPGSSLFLFEKPMSNGPNPRMSRILHCGDFRACPEHIGHPLLKPDVLDSITGKTKQQTINTCYLDTTYLNPRYSFPPQDDVIKACADLCASMSADPNCKDDIWERSKRANGDQAVSQYFQSDKGASAGESADGKGGAQQRLLVVCGTYSIGKERICIAIAQALGSKIFATPGKMKICKQLDDPELSSLLTSNPIEAQVHMQSLMEIRAETLQDYLTTYKPHFSRIVGFRPSGWNFRPTNGKAVGANTSPSSIPTQQILHGKGWRTRFGYKDFVAQRGSTKESMCFGVPYSEHSSFRELAMFLMCLRIEKVIPTVNVGSEQSRKRMRGWIDRWTSERRRGGLVKPLIEGKDDEDGAEMWEGKSGKGGGAWW
ncbi:DNA repair protein Pso2/Snm1 [Purpureocillium lavendulum]|uniref:DNA repair protein Pso2/Snm1 n=1 Tax=Purpureocillium lavendulum TaxID=1247861 RepID=A0AB34G3Z3_9HYPO|nr:DNA repair protein Pso2/Snm1 [Purpureocillium lavendulum]